MSSRIKPATCQLVACALDPGAVVISFNEELRNQVLALVIHDSDKLGLVFKVGPLATAPAG